MGNVTLGSGVKAKVSGGGGTGTIGEGVVGYAQLGTGKSSAASFKAPAGTKKITVSCKIESAGKKLQLRTEKGCSNSSAIAGTDGLLGEVTTLDAEYYDYTFDVNITEETVLYLGAFNSSATVNTKAIQLSK